MALVDKVEIHQTDAKILIDGTIQSHIINSEHVMWYQHVQIRKTDINTYLLLFPEGTDPHINSAYKSFWCFLLQALARKENFNLSLYGFHVDMLTTDTYIVSAELHYTLDHIALCNSGTQIYLSKKV